MNIYIFWPTHEHTLFGYKVLWNKCFWYYISFLHSLVNNLLIRIMSWIYRDLFVNTLLCKILYYFFHTIPTHRNFGQSSLFPCHSTYHGIWDQMNPTLVVEVQWECLLYVTLFTRDQGDWTWPFSRPWL